VRPDGGAERAGRPPDEDDGVPAGDAAASVVMARDPACVGDDREPKDRPRPSSGRGVATVECVNGFMTAS